MAFDDILAAITAHTDEKISTARKEQQEKLVAIRQKNEEDLESLQQTIAQQKEAKKETMLQKAQARAESIVKNAELNKKQELLTKLYTAVAVQMSKLNEKDLTQFFEKIITTLPKDGIVLPAKNHVDLLKKIAGDRNFGEAIEASGGFIFMSDSQEQDYTFDTLLKHTVRPKTEVAVSHSLFL